ncbi:MAG TPA: S-layer homology domain-containing protein [Thermoanaerobaculia bacterium]|jgi:hypothetical protein
MLTGKKVVRVLGLAACAMLCGGVVGAQDRPTSKLLPTGQRPDFGTQDYTVTTISALSFVPRSWEIGFAVSPSLGRYSGTNTHMNYYSTLNVPAGSIIDFIGLNSTTDTDAVLGVGLWQRDSGGNKVLLAGFSAPAHGWGTDLAGPLGIQVVSNLGTELVLDVEQAPNPNFQFFAWVEVWWRRTVSPATTQTFNDVAPGDFGFQFIEALAASGITGGCGGGNFCPNANLTRAQMAVFLSKALGLHWPN